MASTYFKSAVLILLGLLFGTFLVKKHTNSVLTLSSLHKPLAAISERLVETSESPPPCNTKPSTDDAILTRLKYLSLMRHDRRVDCPAVVNGSRPAMESALSVVREDFMSDNKSGAVDFETYFLRLTQSCSRLASQYGFITDILSEEERDFPIAFTIVAYKNIEMLLRLLRAIYRPQNYYCIHLDGTTTTPNMFEAVSNVANCLPNVYMASKRIKVWWASMSSLEADFICMGDMLKHKKWKYLINLTGQEFPLKSNYEMVKILKTYKGANDCPGTTTYVVPSRYADRTFPLGLLPVKGPVHVTLSRPFVDYILHSNVSKELIKFLSLPMFGPDEFFFSTLNYNKQLKVPGGFLGGVEKLMKMEPPFDNNQEYEFIGNTSFNRYKMWMYESASKCANKRQRRICLLSTGDLPRMAASPHLFGNKFFLNDDRVVIGCLEEMLMNRTIDYYLGRRTFDTKLYEKAPFVINSIS